MAHLIIHDNNIIPSAYTITEWDGAFNVISIYCKWEGKISQATSPKLSSMLIATYFEARHLTDIIIVNDLMSSRYTHFYTVIYISHISIVGL